MNIKNRITKLFITYIVFNIIYVVIISSISNKLNDDQNKLEEVQRLENIQILEKVKTQEEAGAYVDKYVKDKTFAYQYKSKEKSWVRYSAFFMRIMNVVWILLICLELKKKNDESIFAAQKRPRSLSAVEILLKNSGKPLELKAPSSLSEATDNADGKTNL